MRFKVKYTNRKTGESYWCTVDANDLPEATKLAQQYERKGFLRGNMIQDEGRGE